MVAGALMSTALLLLFLFFTSPNREPAPQEVSSFTMASTPLDLEGDEVPDAGSADVKAIRDLREQLGAARAEDETKESRPPGSSTSKLRIVRPYSGRFRDTPAKTAARLSWRLRTLASNLRRSLAPPH